jgi:23S rRNA (cytosine1962-C5)-methyltransferase
VSEAAATESLTRAWHWRESRGCLDETEALRMFHGPGEGAGELASVAIDRFGEHYWVTSWGGFSPVTRERIARFLTSRKARSAVVVTRPEKGVPEHPVALLGDPPTEGFAVRELSARFLIRLTGSRHPGLFLDHLPLRRWLATRCAGMRVLNTFAYTGSLSVASALGGATHVTTLDLAKPVIRWAEENWALNGLPEAHARFIAGDVFEWLPRLRREGARYDCVILDPPSFSRGKAGSFSTAKDLRKLHELALELLAPGGVLATSINSANVPWPRLESDIEAAAKARKAHLEVIARVDLPETFPTRLNDPAERYLKGFLLKRA